MRYQHHHGRTGRQRRGYRSDWTIAGLVLSLALVPTLVAVLAAPGLVLAAALGAVTADLARRAAGRYRNRTADREQRSSAGDLC